MEEVIHIPELLQSILILLPLRSLLLSQRVCRTFKLLIDSSPSLQRALYFRPAPSASFRRQERNHLLAEVFAPWFPSTTRPVTGMRRRDLRNPDWNSSNRPGTHTERQDLRNLDWNSSDEKREAYMRSGASWRRMLVAQPPLRKLAVYRGVHAKLDDSLDRAEVTCDGITMGLLVDFTIHEVCFGDVSRSIPASNNFLVRWAGKDVDADVALYFLRTVSDVKRPALDLEDNLDGLVSTDYKRPEVEFKEHECQECVGR